MKQISRLLMGGAILCGLWSCSSDNTPDQPGTIAPDYEAQGYLGINLQLPSQPSTRGINDNFDDGLAAEYKVNNAALLLFVGANEADAEFVGAYTISPNEKFESPDGDQITVSFNKSVKLDQNITVANGSKLYGLALVNYNEDIFTIANGSLSITGTNTKGTSIVRKAGETTGTKFGDLRYYVSAENETFLTSTSGDNYNIFMTNAPLNDKPGTTQALASGAVTQTLSVLDHTKIKPTKAQAEAEPAGCIYVERAVAKLTCSLFPQTVNLKLVTTGEGENATTTPSQTLTVKSVKWGVDNVEKKSYYIRNVVTNDVKDIWGLTYTGKTQARFVGNQAMSYNNTFDDNTTDHTKWHRTYWAADPTYPGRTEVGKTITANELTAWSATKAFYPLENTFDVANQDYRNTTRVIFEVEYMLDAGTKGEDLFVVDGAFDVVYNKTNAENLFKTSVINSVALRNWVKANCKPNNADGKTVDYDETSFTWTFGLDSSDKYYTLKTLAINDKADAAKKLVLKDAAEGFTPVAFDGTSYIATANNDNEVYQYVGGKSYYVVYVQHFGDDYCPLLTNWKGNTTAVVYGEDEAATANFLGRYGMVRNNWYDLTVTQIKNMGSTGIPTADVTTSDDNKEENYYIACNFHILSWAKRTQGVTLQ